MTWIPFKICLVRAFGSEGPRIINHCSTTRNTSFDDCLKFCTSLSVFSSTSSVTRIFKFYFSPFFMERTFIRFARIFCCLHTNIWGYWNSNHLDHKMFHIPQNCTFVNFIEFTLLFLDNEKILNVWQIHRFIHVKRTLKLKALLIESLFWVTKIL